MTRFQCYLVANWTENNSIVLLNVLRLYTNANLFYKFTYISRKHSMRMRSALFNGRYQMSLQGVGPQVNKFEQVKMSLAGRGGRARGSHILCPVAGAGGPCTVRDPLFMTRQT